MLKVKALSDLIESIVVEEEYTLNDLDVENRLCSLLATKQGLRDFAEAFYFIRYDFCCLNFSIGERCGANEFLWSGIVRNLMEELGGRKGPTHNQLYRNFLSCVGARSEESLKEPSYAHQFNAKWNRFCKEVPLSEALSAIAIYEIFDNPDYQLLLRVMQKSSVPKRGLQFFEVHSRAKHFEMFEDVISWLRAQDRGEQAFTTGKEFVFRTQKMMWSDLLSALEKKDELL